jgi:AcrR family transcriptional regulator
LARRHGLAGVTLRDLGAAVDMRGPALYTYFSSKNDIYDAMYSQGLRELAETLDNRQRSDDPVTDFRLQARTFLSFCVDDPHRYELIFQRPIPGFVPSPEAFAFGVSGLARAQVVLDAVGVSGDRPKDLWRAVINGLVSQQIANDPGGDRWVRLLDEAIDMFVSHYGTKIGKGKT